MLILASTMRVVKAAGIDTKPKKIMVFVMLVQKTENIKKKVWKKEIIFILVLCAKDAKINLF